jgi:cob(I)alamin adenosyltransferase
MALFTGKGDGGTTKVFGCDQQRISKSSELPEALGTLDELNSFLGLVKVKADEETAATLRDVQEVLFIVQAETAGADKRVGERRVKEVEALIHEIEKEIPPITSFSIAGGSELSALLDVARTLARRAERRLIGVHDAKLRELSAPTRAYMNRLSSLLFALARRVNHRAGLREQNPSYI